MNVGARVDALLPSSAKGVESGERLCELAAATYRLC
jgi:hypothetical protein